MFPSLTQNSCQNFPPKVVSDNLTLFDNRAKPYGYWAKGYFFAQIPKMVSENLTLFDNLVKPYGYWAEGYFFCKKINLVSVNLTLLGVFFGNFERLASVFEGQKIFFDFRKPVLARDSEIRNPG